MREEKIFQMEFGKVYDLLLNKAVKKGRAKAEVDQVISWLTGDIETCRASPLCYKDFFLSAPQPNPARRLITGVVCGVRVEAVEHPVLRDIRCLDKLIDELAKGRPMEKILRKQPGG